MHAIGLFFQEEMSWIHKRAAGYSPVPAAINNVQRAHCSDQLRSRPQLTPTVTGPTRDLLMKEKSKLLDTARHKHGSCGGSRATVGSGHLLQAALDPQVCSADRWGSRRRLTGWGWEATWPRGDYRHQEEGKEIRTNSEAAFLTSSLLSHELPRRETAPQFAASHSSTSSPSLCPSTQSSTATGTPQHPGAKRAAGGPSRSGATRPREHPQGDLL